MWLPDMLSHQAWAGLLGLSFSILRLTQRSSRTPLQRPEYLCCPFPMVGRRAVGHRHHLSSSGCSGSRLQLEREKELEGTTFQQPGL